MFNHDEFNPDALSNAQLDRLHERLTARIGQREAERAAAKREKNDPKPLRPGIGNGGIGFSGVLARRNWDQSCIEARAKQTVKFAIAPMVALQDRNGRYLRAGDEVRPSEHLDARKGDLMIQIDRLIEQGFVLAKAGVR